MDQNLEPTILFKELMTQWKYSSYLQYLDQLIDKNITYPEGTLPYQQIC